MKHSTLGKILFPLISAGLMAVGPLQTAVGEIVSTENAIQLHERSSRIDRISSVLAKQQIRDQLVEMGVDPQDAVQRIAALSDTELQLLDQRLGELPAGGGGALEVMGIVLLVLLILELVGVTDIFKSI
ncbi:MAG: PA2779 family protein [Gammaproteobacteria bacterium]|nr:PA2779 family protein [Gammaproteobacteria bacterium]MDH4315312.1 PA2779 family protein [Gammaproteobacteria bacterium]MDH5213427.1 PA2779 family protein [Gammaproteobacteria bacterium]